MQEDKRKLKKGAHVVLIKWGYNEMLTISCFKYPFDDVNEYSFSNSLVQNCSDNFVQKFKTTNDFTAWQYVKIIAKYKIIKG